MAASLFLDQSPSSMPASLTASLRRRPVIASCDPTCRTSASLLSGRVSPHLTSDLGRSFPGGMPRGTLTGLVPSLCVCLAAVQETCAWFTENYELARK